MKRIGRENNNNDEATFLFSLRQSQSFKIPGTKLMSLFTAVRFDSLLYVHISSCFIPFNVTSNINVLLLVNANVTGILLSILNINAITD